MTRKERERIQMPAHWLTHSPDASNSQDRVIPKL